MRQDVRDGWKRRPSKQVAICTKREDGEMPNEMGWYEPMGKMVVIIKMGKYMS